MISRLSSFVTQRSHAELTTSCITSHQLAHIWKIFVLSIWQIAHWLADHLVSKTCIRASSMIILSLWEKSLPPQLLEYAIFQTRTTESSAALPLSPFWLEHLPLCYHL